MMYLAIDRNDNHAFVASAGNITDLYWAIDEFTDPYSVRFKPVKKGYSAVCIPIKRLTDEQRMKRMDGGEEDCMDFLRIRKQRTELNEVLSCMLQEEDGWRMFTDETTTTVYKRNPEHQGGNV